MDKKKILIVSVIIMALLIGVFLLISETRSIAFSMPYQDPVYRTDSWQEPVYRTDSYQDPVYGTLYSGSIGNYGLTGQTWTITDASSVSNTYTGKGFWGEEYTTHICWGTNCNDYYKIQFNNLKSETKIISYETKTRQVVDRYDTKYKQVIDHYETKYRTEYKEVTKSRLEWIFS